MCGDILKLFKKDGNENLSKIDNYDLDFLLSLLSNYQIEYRKLLNLSDKVTFGTEIEVGNTDIYKVKTQVDLNKKLNFNWDTESEISVSRGAEITSSIMTDDVMYWNDLKNVCDILKEISIITGETSSHVHVGAHILENNKQYWLNFIKIWSTYENIIYRFTNGEYINTRIAADEYAAPIREMLKKNYLKYRRTGTLYNMLCNLSKERLQAVNFINVNKKNSARKYKNTVEFRTPNGTLDPVII